MKTKTQNILEWLIALYVLLLPVSAVYIFDEKFVGGFKSQYLTGQIFITEPLLWLIFILYIIFNFSSLTSLWRTKQFFKKLREPKRILTLSIWLFVAFSGLSIFWAADKAAAYYLWFHLLEGAALFFVIVSSGIKKEKLFWALIIGAAAEGLIATSQFLTQTIAANKWLGLAAHSAGNLGDIVIETASGRWLRAYGAFIHPNILCGFAAIGFAVAICLWHQYFKSPTLNFTPEKNTLPDSKSSATENFITTWLKLLLLIILTLLATAGLFFSFSLSAWLAALIILIIVLWQNRKSLFNLQYSIFVLSPLLLFVIFSWIFSPLVLARADFSNRLENISGQERLNQVSQTFGLIKKHPPIGIGINNFTVELQKLYPRQPAYAYQPVHNIYLLITAELGLIGLAIFIIIMFHVICYMLYDSKIFISAASFLMVTFIIGLFDHYFWTQYVGIILFWLSLTFIADNIKIINQHE